MKKKQLIWKVKKITYRYKEQLYIDVENINYNGFKMGICLHLHLLIAHMTIRSATFPNLREAISMAQMFCSQNDHECFRQHFCAWQI